MKNFASPSFFRTFELLMGVTNPGVKLTQWLFDGVEWVCDRYSVTGQPHGFAIEIVTLTRPGRRGWSLMVTKEHWWAGTRTEAIKSLHWARAVSGQQKDIIDWFRTHEAALDCRTPPGTSGAAR